MKTIYLKAQTKAEIVADIQQVCPYSDAGRFPIGYTGQTEYSGNGIHVHYIGDVVVTAAVIGPLGTIISPAVFSGFQHANILVPDDFDGTIFSTQIPSPSTPKHVFA